MDLEDPYGYDNQNCNISLDNEQSRDDSWEEDEEIELGSDENELFLRDEYVKPKSNNILPYRVSISPNDHHTQLHMSLHNSDRQSRNGFSKYFGRQKSGSGQSNASSSHDYDGSKPIESFQMDDSGRGSPTPPSSVAYQMPNHKQFAGNLAPTSPNSVIVSFIIIFVILAVTIVPKVIPKSQSLGTGGVYDDLDAYDDDVIEKSPTKTGSFAQEYPNQSVHSDARCKCICPPLLSSLQSSVPNNGTSSSNSSVATHSNSTTPATSIITSNSKTANQRRLYVGNTLPDQCNCNNIVRAHFNQDTKVSFKEFCARCECRYQSRNTSTIKRNVVFFIAVLTGLALYLVVQYLLKQFRITRRNLPPHLRWLSHQMTESN